MNAFFPPFRWIRNLWPKYIENFTGNDLRVTRYEYRLCARSCPVWRYAHLILSEADLSCSSGHLLRLSNDPSKAYQLVLVQTDGSQFSQDPMNFGLHLYEVFRWMCSEQVCTGRIFLGKDEKGKKRFLHHQLRLIDPGTLPNAIFSFTLTPRPSSEQ